MHRFGLSEKGSQDLIAASIYSTLQSIVLMLPVILIYYLLDDLLKGEVPVNHYYLFGIGGLIFILLFVIVTYLEYNACFVRIYIESAKKRISLAEHLRLLPLSFFAKKDVVDMSENIMGDVASLETSFSHYIPQFIGSIASTLIVSISLFFFNYKMAIASLWVFPVSLLIILISSKINFRIKRKLTNLSLDLEDNIQEALTCSVDLKVNNASKAYLEKLNKKIAKMERKQRFAELIAGLFVNLSGSILRIGIVTTALLGIALLVQGEISLLMYIMFLLVAARIYDPMTMSLVNLTAIILSEENIQRMKTLLNTPIQKGKKEVDYGNYNIEFKNVTFAYEDEVVLQNVSLKAKQGEITALVGPSGGGKSTVAKLCSRFYDPNAGEIFLGKANIKEVDPETLLKEYSIVFQDVVLFNDSVLENIRIGRKDATDAECLLAAKEANCLEFIEKMPDKEKTMIGENGCKLSGGERQRISIARAILKNSPVILLDEATASLDAENENEIQKALSALLKNKTVIIIAHRMRTIEKADHVIYLKDGQIAEEGTPEELLKKDGYYKKVLSLQKGGENWSI